MLYTRSAVMLLIRSDVSSVLGRLHLREQIGMIAFFDAENRVTTRIVQGLDMGGIGTQTVIGDDEFDMGMILAQLAMKRLAALCSQSFWVAPSYFTIGSGISRITARTSG